MDAGEDIIGGLGPAERLWIGIGDVDVGVMAVSSSATERNTPRLRVRAVRSAKKRSTWLIHDADVGV